MKMAQLKTKKKLIALELLIINGAQHVERVVNQNHTHQNEIIRIYFELDAIILN